MQNVHDSSVLIRLLIQSRQDRGQTFDADGRLGKQDVNRVQDKQLNSASRVLPILAEHGMLKIDHVPVLHNCRILWTICRRCMPV